MFSAHKPTIVNEGIIPPMEPVPPMPPQNPVFQPPQVPNPVNQSNPVVLPPGSPNSRYKKVLLIFVPAGFVVGAMVLMTFLISQYKKPQPIVATPSPIPTLIPATPVPTPQADPFQDWKSYVNRPSEISFKYPPTIKLKEEVSSGLLSVVLTKETDGSIELAQFMSSKTQTVDALLKKYVSSGATLDSLSEEEIQVSGVTAKFGQFVSPTGGEGMPLFYSYLTHNNINFVFIGKVVSEKETFTKILSTARFVTPGVTDEWRDLNSNAGSFSLKYPPTWSVSYQSVEGEKISTESAKLLYVTKNKDDKAYQSLVIQISNVTGSGKEKVQLTASELITSLQNLSGWKTTPTLDFRSLGAAQAQLISGVKDGVWTQYGVFWVRNILVQINWTDTALRQEQETVDDILSTLKFR